MRFLILIILLASCSSLHGQETKFITYGNNLWVKEFYVLKSNEDIKHGSYIWYEFAGEQISILEQGEYQQGKKNGLWSYFYQSGIKFNPDAKASSLRVRAFYTDDIRDGQWDSYYLDTVSNVTNVNNHKGKKKRDSVTIEMTFSDLKPRISGRYKNNIRVGEWYAFDFTGNIFQCFDYTSSQLLIDKSLDSAECNRNHNPIFLGGMKEMSRSFTENINPEIAIWAGKNPIVVLEFIVNRDGTLSEVNASKGKAPVKFREEVKRLLFMHADSWIPALKDGIPISKSCNLSVELLRNNYKWNAMQFRVNVTDQTR